MIEHRCKHCGGELTLGGERYTCRYCGSTYDAETAKAEADALRALLDEAKMERVCAGRRALYDAITAPHISREEVRRAAQDLKQYLPADPMVKFFLAATGRDVRLVDRAIGAIDPETQYDEIPLVLDFLIRSLSADEDHLLSLNDLVERAYKNRDLTLFHRYATKISEEAERVRDGVYETALPRDVFVAYSGKDMPVVTELVTELESQGLTCFVAARNLRHGIGAVEDYDHALKEAIDHCHSVVFVSTLNSRHFNCDALRVELAYIRGRDMEGGPSQYRNAYEKLPHMYKKPRVEYRVQESDRRNAADKLVEEFFEGYERVYTPADVAERVMKQLVETASTETAPVETAPTEPIPQAPRPAQPKAAARPTQPAQPAQSKTAARPTQPTQPAKTTPPAEAAPKKSKSGCGWIVLVALVVAVVLIAKRCSDEEWKINWPFGKDTTVEETDPNGQDDPSDPANTGDQDGEIDGGDQTDPNGQTTAEGESTATGEAETELPETELPETGSPAETLGLSLLERVPEVEAESEGETEDMAEYTTISTAADLELLRTSPTGKFILGNDINYQGDLWAPVENFSGVLDGNGYAIKNLIMQQHNDVAGLVGTNSGTIKDLAFENITCQIDFGARWEKYDMMAGVVAGANTGTIENCTVHASEIHVTGGQGNIGCDGTMLSAGAIVGYNNGVVSRCTNKANITMTVANYTEYGHDVNDRSAVMYSRVGGIVGINCKQLVQCTNTGTVTLEMKMYNKYPNLLGSRNYVGGIAGQNNPEAVVSACVAEGSIDILSEGTSARGGSYLSKYVMAGMMVGENHDLIENCIGHGRINCDNSGWNLGGDIGGMIGVNWTATAVVRNLYSDVDIYITGGNQELSVGGILGRHNAANAVLMKCIYNGKISMTHSNLTADSAKMYYGFIVGQCGSGLCTNVYYSDTSSVLLGGAMAAPTDKTGAKESLSTLRQSDFIFNTLYWDPAVWQVSDPSADGT